MDPAACRVIYIDDRFNTERWISRDGLTTPATPQKASPDLEFSKLPQDLQANVNAFLTVFNQVFVCRSGRSFSTKLSELHDQVLGECTPIIACFDVGSETRQKSRLESHVKLKTPQKLPSAVATTSDSPPPSPTLLRREITFSSESDESYGLQLLSRIASDLQVDESVQLIIPVAIVQPNRKDSYDVAIQRNPANSVSRAPFGSETEPVPLEDASDFIEPALMLQCLEAGALDVVKSPLDKAGIMGLTVHAYRIYKNAKKEEASFLASVRTRKQSWVGVEEEKPYAYLREAMVKKLLKGICDPQHVIEDYQHRQLHVEQHRQDAIADAVGRWGFDGHNFSEDELVYAGYYMLNHALQLPELVDWRIDKGNLLRFMQGCRVAYNSFVLYHNFRHAVDVLQSLFHFLVQIGTLPPYPNGAAPPPKSQSKSPVAKLLGSFEALTLLISAIGHDVGHPGVNNMFLVKLNAPLAQLYNDQSVLEAFHCAAYSQILRRHWPAAFHDKAIRKLMISTILATDMGVHSDYMQQLGNLQERIHESKATDGWSPKDIDSFRVLTCGLLIKCADISNVARPWSVAEKWTYLLQKEFAKQGEMESAVGMETTLFGGPPELGNMLKLANGQIGFMTIFAHPLFANVADIIPAMSFAADEIITNKGVWFTRAEKEKMKTIIRKGTGFGDGGAVSPRSQSPVGKKQTDRTSYFPSSPLATKTESPRGSSSLAGGSEPGHTRSGNTTPQQGSRRSSLQAVAGVAMPVGNDGSRRSSAHSARGRKSKDMGVNGTHQSKGIAFKTPAFSGSSENEDPNRGTPSSAPAGNDNATSAEELNDTRRDNAVSMRAGSTALPVSTPAALNHLGDVPSGPLSSFDFATSKPEDEPVRHYSPHKEYAVPAQFSRSVPANDITNRQQRQDVKEAQQRVVDNDADQHNALTPSHSTEATSYISEKSEVDSSSPRKGDFDAKRTRAISAPMNAPHGGQQQQQGVRSSFSVSSTQSGSLGSGSKMEYQSMLNGSGTAGGFGGGELGRSESDFSGGGVEVTGRERTHSTRTLGRKRSRIKMGLMFWKSKEEKERGKSVAGGEGYGAEGRGEDGGSGIGSGGEEEGAREWQHQGTSTTGSTGGPVRGYGS